MKHLKHFSDYQFFQAGDHTILAEVLHPKNEDIDLPFSIAYAKINPGDQSLPHTLTGSETYIFTAGNGTIVIDGETQPVAKGTVILVPSQASQHVVNQGAEDLCFYCIVSPAWSEAEEIIHS